MSIFYNVPHSLPELNTLLAECQPGNLTPLTSCAKIACHKDLNDFIQLIAYPLQSYERVDDAHWNSLREHVKRLFPSPGSTNRETLRTHIIAMVLFEKIVMRCSDSSKTYPCGLDTLAYSSWQFPPLSTYGRLLLEGGVLPGSENEEAVTFVSIITYLNQKGMLEERIKLIEKDLLAPKMPLHAKASSYQTILNLLLFEQKWMHAIWKWTCHAEIGFKELWLLMHIPNLKALRVNACLVQYTPHESYEISFQYQLILKQFNHFLKLSGSPHQPASLHNKNVKRLKKLYHSLRTIQQNLPENLFKLMQQQTRSHATHLEHISCVASVRDMRRHYLGSPCALIAHQLNQNKSTSFGEDLIAPFNMITHGLIRKLEEYSKEEIEELRVRHGMNWQLLADLKEVCCVYQQHASHQDQLYQYFYQKLEELIRSSQQKRDFMLYKHVQPFMGEGQLSPTLTPLPLANITSEFLELIDTIPQEESPSLQASTEWPLPDYLLSLTLPSKRYPARIKFPRKQKVKVARPGITRTSSAAASATSPLSPSTAARAHSDNSSDTEELEATLPDELEAIEAPLPAPFHYASRVARWRQCKMGERLDHILFPEYAESNPSHQQLMIHYHGFSPTVDFFVEEMAAKTAWKSKRGSENLLYILPAEFSIPSLNKIKMRGAFTYCLDHFGKLYHRCFAEKSSSLLVSNIVSKTFSEIDFPELKSILDENGPEEVQTAQQNSVPFQKEEEIWTEDLGSVVIYHRTTKVKIKLFRTSFFPAEN